MGKLVDLTGTTITLPAGWTASEGYGQFNILGSLKAFYLPTNKEFSCILDYSRPNFQIGYKPPSIYAENCLTIHYDNGYTSKSFNNPNFDLNFTITGGIDVTNQDLIQWFVDNNAIIEGGVYDEETEEEPTEPIPNIITLQGITVALKGFPIQEVEGILPDNPYSLNIEVNGITYNTFAYLEDAIYLSNDNGDSLEIMDTTTEFKILGGAEATNPNMINFIRTNFDAVSGVADTATIIYKDIEKVVQAGLTASLNFANKKFTEDIVITFTQNGVITYKGVETTVQAGQTATLKCSGKKMTDDLYITVGSANNVSLIAFTINAGTYQAKEGMTWEQWINSEYNTGGYLINSDGNITTNSGVSYVRKDGNNVYKTEVIIANYIYTTYTDMGGSN